MIDYLNNGKVLIGSQYDRNPLKPKYVEQDPDMLRLQSYLIHDPARLKQIYWTNLGLKVALVGILILMVLRW